MRFTKTLVAILFLLSQFGCNSPEAQINQNKTAPAPNIPKMIADKFAYPIGKTEIITQAKDQKDN